MRKNFMLAALALGCLAAAAAPGEKAFTPGMATISPLRAPPKIDGKFDPKEWDGATATCGFLIYQGGGGGSTPTLYAYQGRSYIGYAAGKLYLAVLSELPPDGKLVTSAKNRDSNTVFDDSVEVWLDPNRDLRRQGVDQSKLGLFQVIANSTGAIYDMECKGVPNMAWNGNWEMANALDTQRQEWIAELSLPLADLGIKPAEVAGRSLGILLARNFKRPWNQLTAFPHVESFSNYLAFPRIVLTQDAPSVQVESLGDEFASGQLDFKLKIFNPAAGRQVKVTTHIDSTDGPAMEDSKLLSLPANGSGHYDYKPPKLRFLETAIHQVSVSVTSPDGKETYFRHFFTYRAMPKKWNFQTQSGPDYANAVKFAYYPSFNLLRVKVDTNVLDKAAANAKSAQVTVTGGGKEWLKAPMAWDKQDGTREFPIPDLPDGQYLLKVELAGYVHVFERNFLRKHFPWEGNQLGVTSKIYKPFEPIRVDGRTLSVVRRGYQVGKLGLWDSVKADGRELLAGPSVLKIGGKAVEGEGAFAKVKTRRVKGYEGKDDGKGVRVMAPVYEEVEAIPEQRATYQGQAKTPAATIKTTCETEYDGCMKVTLDLLPGTERGKPLEDLVLEIPVKDSEAPLWHASTTSLRANPAGFAPKGEGKVWDSNDFPDGEWRGNFKCYLWVGGPERGVCWFADNDRGWELDAKGDKFAPCQELVRKDGALTIKVNLIQKPTLIDKPRRIVFGVMATPAKPMLENWRNVNSYLAFQMSYYNDTTFCAKSPRLDDYTVLDKMQELRLGGVRGRYLEYYQANDLKGLDAKAADTYLNLLNLMFNVASEASAYFCTYQEEFHTTATCHEATKVFQSEWSGRDYRDFDPKACDRLHEDGISTSNIVSSYVDFACWNFAEQIRRGIGVYFDNSFPMRAYDLKTTNAYVLPDGSVQPSAGIWARREFLKRVWVLHQQLAPAATKPLMMIHMTNSNIVPYLVWSEAALDLEWMYGEHPAQAVYPVDMLQAESLGLQTGNVPFVLALTQNRFQSQFIHEARFFGGTQEPDMEYVKWFGYGKPDCEVFNYWNEGYPVVPSDPAVKSILLKKDGKLLLVFASWNAAKSQVEFKLDLDKLGCRPGKAFDTYTGKPLEYRDGKLALGLKEYGVGMVQFE